MPKGIKTETLQMYSGDKRQQWTVRNVVSKLLFFLLNVIVLNIFQLERQYSMFSDMVHVVNQNQTL